VNVVRPYTVASPIIWLLVAAQTSPSLSSPSVTSEKKCYNLAVNSRSITFFSCEPNSACFPIFWSSFLTPLVQPCYEPRTNIHVKTILCLLLCSAQQKGSFIRQTGRCHITFFSTKNQPYFDHISTFSHLPELRSSPRLVPTALRTSAVSPSRKPRPALRLTTE